MVLNSTKLAVGCTSTSTRSSVNMWPTLFQAHLNIDHDLPTPPSTPPDSPLLAPAITYPAEILAILRSVDAAATLVCNEIDKALELELEHEARRVLTELRKGVESLGLNTIVYKILLSAMEKDADLNDSSTYTRFIQQYVMELHSSSHAHRTDNLQYTD